MRFLYRIWRDFRKGENIDLYVTVVVALGLVALNLSGFAPKETLEPITLAILGLIAISILGSRYRVEELSSKLDQSANTVFINEFPPSLKTDIESAPELWLVGVSLTRTIRTYYSTIEQKLQRGHSVKVMVVSPEDNLIELVESRAYGRPNISRTRNDINGTLEDLCELQQSNPQGKLYVRTVKNTLTFGATIVNPNSPSGVLYLEHYPFKMEGGSRPKFILRPKDGYWYDFFKKEIKTLWDYGIDWNCNQNTS
jgi:hypothetical protein